MRRKIILDVDTGSDDAVAIMLAAMAEELEILGVVAVNGNRPLNETLYNTLQIVELLHRDIPVIKGASQPLVKELFPGRMANPSSPAVVKDENGREIAVHPATFSLPRPSLRPVRQNFISWYLETLQNSNEKITLVAVGPLTDLALLFRVDPSVIDHIEEIVIMGGSNAFGNRSAAAEFNIWKDPEAAEIVFQCGAPITLVPLDATHTAFTRLSEATFYRDMNTALGDFMAELIELRCRAYNLVDPQKEEDVCPIHDALAVAYLLCPSVLQDVVETRVDVDCSGGFADGRTVIDLRKVRDLPNNCRVALSADRDLYNRLLIAKLSLYRNN